MSKPELDTGLNQKFADLEARIAFQEDYLAAMNKRIAEQDQEIAKLQMQLKHVNDKFRDADSDAGHTGSLVDERPPHY